MPDEPLRFATRLIHAGAVTPRVGGAAVLPIFQSTVFEQPDGADYDDILYPRLSTLPNHRVLGARLASLESGEAGLVASSGMAAITATLLSLLQGGGHLLAQGGLYGGTHGFVAGDLPKLGGSCDFVDVQDPGGWKAKLRPQTRAFYVETLTNPTMAVADHRAVVAFAREHDLVSVIDNTFATPVNFRPLELGYDMVVHSATKYLNGHSDIVAGALVGAAARVREAHHLLNHLGGSLDPHACFLLERGLKTLALRMRQHNESSLKVAAFLAARPEVRHVNHPGLPSHPQHARARELFAGTGGMLSFDLGSAAAATAWIRKLRLPIHGPSLGGPETLVTRPVATSHASVPREERERLGITDGLVRMSVGLEDTDDLLADFERAFVG